MKNHTHINEKDREKIYILKKRGYKVTQIADEIEVHRSNIYKEFTRNTSDTKTITIKGKVQYIQYYSAEIAQKKSEERRKNRTNKKLIKGNQEITDYIISKLKMYWSPLIISGRMRREKLGSVHPETIYKFIYSKEGQTQNLSSYLARAKKTRTKHLGRKRNKTKIPNRIDILTRPKIINERSTIGHFEGDSIVGIGKGSALHTEVDRHSRYTLIKKIAKKTAELTAEAMTEIFSSLPKEKVLSTTLDNGTEFCKWEKVVENIGLDIYFARPYRSSERGTNERMNGFVRKFFPKKTDFNIISDQQIQVVQDWINHRPMQVLDFRTPFAVFVAFDNRL